ncbi:MAG TPA: right-handed parallel beta-helix repeat-containing protein, partial [bacterium]|nr:right-handed parallel beta-helix repeat-containing protein [bacterium]
VYFGIKFTGVVDFALEKCVIENWPDGGAGINLLGSHWGVVTGCTLRNSVGRGEMGLQAKGGTADILISGNRFFEAGLKALSLGGSTGLNAFHPSFQGSETKNITVEGNLIVGSESAIVFASSENVIVRFNTIYLPHKWAVRILQDNNQPGSIPCRNGQFTDNIVVFRSGWTDGGINVGKGTAPETFRFARNLWYCENRPGWSQPFLPVPEKDGVYGKDPLFRDPARNDFSLQEGSPATGKGRTAMSTGA